MDYGFKRDREPWEASDGAVYLLAGLAEVAPGEVLPLLPQLAELALLDHFPQARSLQATIWHQLPAVLKSLGKKVTPVHDSQTCDGCSCRNCPKSTK